MERKSVAMFVLALLLSSSLFGCISPEEKPIARIEEDVIKQILNAPDTISISNPVETIQYDLANNYLLAVTNSALEVSKYWVANDPDAVIIDDSWKTILKIDGNIVQNPTNIFARSGTFTCEYDLGNVKVFVTTFSNNSTNAIFQRYYVLSEDGKEHTVELTVGVEFDLGDPKNLMVDYAKDAGHGVIVASSRKKSCFLWASDIPVNHQERRNKCELSYNLITDESASLYLAISGGWDIEVQRRTFTNISKNWERYLRDAINRSNWIDSIFRSEDKLYETMFTACLDCALSNYKETKDGDFKGFFAGVRYKEPARTYFRDSYWTVQCVLPFRPDLIRDQIISLAKGVHDSGACGSGVKFNGKDWWSYHYDSPSFFVMMIYDYVTWTGDESILDEMTKGKAFDSSIGLTIWSREKSVWDKAKRTLKWLKRTDKDHDFLIEKPKNRFGDWADEVERVNEVTYVNSLYYRALVCASELAKLNGEETNATKYLKEAARVKKALNELMWDEELGYYLDFITHTKRGTSYREDHFAEDTFVALLYGVADLNQRKSCFEYANQWLVSRNNEKQPYGDWGTLCAWPLYKNTTYRKPRESCDAYRYHNGADWPYLDGVNALTRLWFNDPNWEYPLTRWWEHSLESNWLTPVEHYQPEFPHGGLRQAWSSMPAAAMILGGFGFWPGLYETIHIKSPAWGDSEINGIKYRGHSYDIIVIDGVVTLYEDGKKIQTGASTATIKV